MVQGNLGAAYFKYNINRAYQKLIHTALCKNMVFI